MKQNVDILCGNMSMEATPYADRHELVSGYQPVQIPAA